MLDKLRIKITLFATLIVTLYAYIYNKDFVKTCYIIVITIGIFYFLGGFIEIFLKNKIEEINNKNKETESDNEEENMYILEEFEEQENEENLIK